MKVIIYTFGMCAPESATTQAVREARKTELKIMFAGYPILYMNNFSSMNDDIRVLDLYSPHPYPPLPLYPSYGTTGTVTQPQGWGVSSTTNTKMDDIPF